MTIEAIFLILCGFFVVHSLQENVRQPQQKEHISNLQTKERHAEPLDCWELHTDEDLEIWRGLLRQKSKIIRGNSFINLDVGHPNPEKSLINLSHRKGGKG